MTSADKSSFQFNRFIVNESFFSYKKEGEFKLGINISPSGKILLKRNQFHLFLTTEVKDEEEKFIASVKTLSIFTFSPESDIDAYKSTFFTKNAPALVFPYIRAYLSTLTAQSGLINISLPTLNLTPLAKDLKNNIEVIED